MPWRLFQPVHVYPPLQMAITASKTKKITKPGIRTDVVEARAHGFDAQIALQSLLDLGLHSDALYQNDVDYIYWSDYKTEQHILDTFKGTTKAEGAAIVQRIQLHTMTACELIDIILKKNKLRLCQLFDCNGYFNLGAKRSLNVTDAVRKVLYKDFGGATLFLFRKRLASVLHLCWARDPRMEGSLARGQAYENAFDTSAPLYNARLYKIVGDHAREDGCDDDEPDEDDATYLMHLAAQIMSDYGLYGRDISESRLKSMLPVRAFRLLRHAKEVIGDDTFNESILNDAAKHATNVGALLRDIMTTNGLKLCQFFDHNDCFNLQTDLVIELPNPKAVRQYLYEQCGRMSRALLQKRITSVDDLNAMQRTMFDPKAPEYTPDIHRLFDSCESYEHDENTDSRRHDDDGTFNYFIYQEHYDAFDDSYDKDLDYEDVAEENGWDIAAMKRAYRLQARSSSSNSSSSSSRNTTISSSSSYRGG